MLFHNSFDRFALANADDNEHIHDAALHVRGLRGSVEG